MDKGFDHLYPVQKNIKLLLDNKIEKMDVNLDSNRLTSNITKGKYWKKNAVNIMNRLKQNQIDFILFKVFESPFTNRGDIDFIMENIQDIKKMLLYLEQHNFILYKDRHSFNKYKITAYSKNNYEIDIYPEATWFNMRYAAQNYITSNSYIRKNSYMEAKMPDPTTDFLITISHSYNHGSITIMEIIHVMILINNYVIDWDELMDVVDKYYLNHILYTYLRIIYLINNKIYKEKCNKVDINELMQKSNLNLFYNIWLNYSIYKKPPFRIPLPLRIYSGICRLFHSPFKKYAKPYGELFGYLLAFRHRGKRTQIIYDVKKYFKEQI